MLQNLVKENKKRNFSVEDGVSLRLETLAEYPLRPLSHDNTAAGSRDGTRFGRCNADANVYADDGAVS